MAFANLVWLYVLYIVASALPILTFLWIMYNIFDFVLFPPQIQTVGQQQVIATVDPEMAASGLPPYPPLPANTDASKVEEIRRTVYVGNIPKEVIL